MELNENLKIVKEAIEKARQYYRIIAKLSFDFSCTCPKNGKEEAAEDMQVIEDMAFKLTHNKKYFNALEYLNNHKDELDYYDKELIRQLYLSYERTKNITPKFNKEFSLATSKNQIAWFEAKNNSSYQDFAPYLEKTVKLTKQKINFRDKKEKTIYDTILNDFEPGSSIEFLDNFFNSLKEGLIPLIKKINESKTIIRDDFLSYKVPTYKQELFSKYLLEVEGHNFDTLVLATTEHPFTMGAGTHDERVTTHYYEESCVSNIYSILHEGGHALFDLNEPEEFKKHHINQNMTMGMHECMSRFFENYIGRSKEFIHLIYPKFIELFDEFKNVSEEELYKAINISKPSLIRTEADELTYPFHIMIRYELEKEFVNGNVDFKTLNQKWNEKYKNYLGVEVTSDKDGILQDVHWCDVYGYFPSYALGSAYGAQIYKTMDKCIDIKKCILDNRLDKIVNWFKDNVWNIASITDPNEWIIKITGEPLNTKYFIDYLNEKYKSIYNL